MRSSYNISAARSPRWGLPAKVHALVGAAHISSMNESAVPDPAKVCNMNTYSPAQVAERLGTSRRRVTHAALLAGLGQRDQTRVRFTDPEVVALAGCLGVTPSVEGLTRIESLVLAELARRPFGLVSYRAVARACAISTASASKAVSSLLAQGLVTEARKTVALGRAREVSVIKANVSHPDWTRLLAGLRTVAPANRSESAHSGLPSHVRHAFWNVDDRTFRRLDLDTDGPFIAARALTTGDANLMAFAADRLPAQAWGSALHLRGLSPESRQTARNLALAGKSSPSQDGHE